MKTTQTRILSEEERRTLDQALEIIRKHLPHARIILYGSRARGEARRDSDYDLLVLTPHKISSDIEDAIFDETYDVLLKTGQWISVRHIDHSTWDSPVVRGSPFYEEVNRDGVEL